MNQKKKNNTDYLHSLFDICSCKFIDRITCKCIKGRKIHWREWDFLQDQRKDRERLIGGVDKRVTGFWKDIEKRSEAKTRRNKNEEVRSDQIRESQAKKTQEFMDNENNCETGTLS